MKDYNTYNKFQENTEKPSLNKLDAQLLMCLELNNLLNTPARHLSRNYKYLVDKIYKDDENKTLDYTIKENLAYKQHNKIIKKFNYTVVDVSDKVCHVFNPVKMRP